MSKKVFCKRCNRKLTSDVSIDRGYGKVCYKKFKEEEINKNQLTIYDIINQ